MGSPEAEHLLEKLARRGMSRRQLLQLMGLAGVGSAAAFQLDPVLAAIHWERHPGADRSSYEPRRGLAAQSLAKETALSWIENNRAQIIDLSDRIWEYAELSLREWRSSLALATFLRDHGFTIEWGIAGLPTFFIATYSQGSGKPVMGFNGECDALPGLSQRGGSPVHDPLEFNDDPYRPSYGPGHGDAHNTLGAASAAAAVAVAQAMRRHNLDGTLKFFGSAGEEQLVGKCYAVRAGAYEGLDAFVDWHPGTDASTSWGSNSALLSVVFTFLGVAGHGAEPLGNKSALDGVELLNIMTEYLREKNVAPSGRFHYAIPYGGEAPNVTPEIAHAWYYVREGSPARLRVLYDKIVACARAAAEASQTDLHIRVVAGTWNTLGNQVGTELRYENMLLIGPPDHSEEDHALARAIQATLGVPQVGLTSREIVPLRPPGVFLGGPSTDMGDVSWHVPTIRGLSATRPALCPNHHWNVTATACTGIAHKGMLRAAQYIAATVIDLLTQPAVLAQVQEEFYERTAGIQWQSLLPDDAQPPVYQPPDWFLRETNQAWPPPGIDWPPPRYVSHGQYGTTGPRL
ncbi:MAG TPA: amidohydrolase [Chloroflexota bacterium]|nr:amidohydrolase [Chloroflexota bacterium]